MVAYETGVASSPQDLFNKVSVFVEANGWLVDPPASGDGVFRNGSSGVGIFAGVDATTNSWSTRGALGYSAAVAWDAQPGNSGFTHMINIGAGPYTSYHCWVGDEDGNDYIHLAIEKSAGEFRHWSLGRVVPFGTITGGVYCDGTWLEDSTIARNSPDHSSHRHLCDANTNLTGGHLWVDYDAKVNTWQAVTNSQAATRHYGSTRSNGMWSNFESIGPQNWNFRTPLWPMTYFANRASNLRSPIGRMPNIRSVNVRNFFPGQEVTIGSDVWKIFPVFQKQIGSVANTIVSSGLYGYAYLMP